MANDVGYANDVHFVNDVASLLLRKQTSHHCDLKEQHHYAKLNIISLLSDTSLKTYQLRTVSFERIDIMKENKLAELSMDFSVDIINLVKHLKSMHESIISNQIGRSGTSIGANIYEAQYAHGKKDFIAKLEIALKEANETGYWLELLYKTNYIDKKCFNTLSYKCTSIRVMLIASCRTAKESINNLM